MRPGRLLRVTHPEHRGGHLRCRFIHKLRAGRFSEKHQRPKVHRLIRPSDTVASQAFFVQIAAYARSIGEQEIARFPDKRFLNDFVEETGRFINAFLNEEVRNIGADLDSRSGDDRPSPDMRRHQHIIHFRQRCDFLAGRDSASAA